MIAALYVQHGGVYYGLPGVEPWGLPERDARQYAGPYPVVAHPPCARWGRYWGGGPSANYKRKLGDDDGCFAAALEAVRRWGGVIEHPEGSHAWRHHGLPVPRRGGGWQRDIHGGWTCCVEQGWYGHRARKATWLYYVGPDPKPLSWGKAPGDFVRLDDGFHSIEERRKAIKRGFAERLSHRERAATPEQFRDALLELVRGATT